jgi:hypothetical protein
MGSYRPLVLGNLDAKVQQYIQALRRAGTPVGSEMIIASAKGVTMSVDCTLLEENGGHLKLAKTWASL